MPLNVQPARSLSSHPPTWRLASQQKRRVVLIVDDNDLLLPLMEYWMREDGDTLVFPCLTYRQAERVLEKVIPDVLIADVRLGDYNGIQLALMTRHSNPEASIVVVTAFNDPVLRREAEQVGAQFLVKPLRRQALMDAVHGVGSSGAGY